MRVLVCSFSGVYNDQKIRHGAEYIDFQKLRGCGMYLDDTAAAFIMSKLTPYGAGGLHFIDNGNYHYMTGLFLSLVCEDFDLIHFDHHTDDMPPAFEGLRSCGSWVYDLKRENTYLKDYTLIRSFEDLGSYNPSERPVYISVDKDVLSEDVLKTNWDQGDMTKEEFFAIFEKLILSRKLIGIDICGEDEPGADFSANEAFNLEVIKLLKDSSPQWTA